VIIKKESYTEKAKSYKPCSITC